MSLIEPKKKPKLKDGDFHLIVNDETETCKIFDHTGKLVRKLKAKAKGVNGSSTWPTGGDTPPGLYKLGQLFRAQPEESKQYVWFPYGPLCWDMEEQEGQENERGRAGICLHGGGSNCPDPLADYQPLLPTHGCVRMHNKDLADYVLPLTHKYVDSKWKKRTNTVYISVYQDRD